MYVKLTDGMILLHELNFAKHLYFYTSLLRRLALLICEAKASGVDKILTAIYALRRMRSLSIGYVRQFAASGSVYDFYQIIYKSKLRLT